MYPQYCTCLAWTIPNVTPAQLKKDLACQSIASIVDSAPPKNFVLGLENLLYFKLHQKGHKDAGSELAFR